MMGLESQVRRYVCRRVYKPMDGGSTSPLLVQANDREKTVPIKLVMKLRHPPNGEGTSHVGSTSLIAELVASLLARAVGVMVPDFGVIELSEELAGVSAPEEPEIRVALKESVGENFASALIGQVEPWMDVTFGRRPSGGLKDNANAVLQFDASIWNADRGVDTTNLLVDGEDLYCIDHSMSFAVRDQATQVACPPIQDGIVERHCTRPVLLRSGVSPDCLLKKWFDLPGQVFDEVEQAVPTAWETTPGDNARIVEFARRRRDVFAENRAKLVRVVS